MNYTEIDLLQYKDKKDPILKCSLSLLAAFLLWSIILIRIWSNYNGNWLNYYQATSYMVFFVIMVFWAVYISHQLNLRVPLYSILAIISMLVYLNGVNQRIPVLDMVTAFIIRATTFPGYQEKILDAFYDMKAYIGDSFYEALLTWVIIDVPFQIIENDQERKWETSVKYVYHSISNQILFLASMNADISTIHIQNNQVHDDKIESFCKKRIKQYSRKLLLCRNNSPSSKRNLQTKEQYERLLFLLQEIHSNPHDLDGRKYLKLLYETEAIFMRSKIINSSTS